MKSGMLVLAGLHLFIPAGSRGLQVSTCIDELHIIQPVHAELTYSSAHRREDLVFLRKPGHSALPMVNSLRLLKKTCSLRWESSFL